MARQEQLKQQFAGGNLPPSHSREPWLGGKPAPKQVQLIAHEDNLGLQPELRLKAKLMHGATSQGTKPCRQDYPIYLSTTVSIGFSAATAV
jgi:hypothetical protein